ncbi:hypothetical protein [Aquabacterium sp. OR-4]|uniref:hypothetical protein n=1 Tax=Aquabacterium sp. OR-4 TaxID=2978127 RepID=UPI0021B1B22C|nr:hypothetical protein [Aquabacterium sp. OR-4]MDT7838494.1 hypothetical protein [Aquabacterium sp. OR-4]
MTPFTRLTRRGLAATLLAGSLGTLADAGHDHGPAQPAVAGAALPRFAAQSDQFELVGVLDGRRLNLYLDRFADNAPVPGARIELDLAGSRHSAQPQPDGSYTLLLKAAPAPGLLSVTATVSLGAEVDLLAADLDVGAPAHAHGAEPGPGGWFTPARLGGALGAVGAGLALALALLLNRLRRRLASTAPGAAAAPAGTVGESA